LRWGSSMTQPLRPPLPALAHPDRRRGRLLPFGRPAVVRTEERTRRPASSQKGIDMPASKKAPSFTFIARFKTPGSVFAELLTIGSPPATVVFMSEKTAESYCQSRELAVARSQPLTVPKSYVLDLLRGDPKVKLVLLDPSPDGKQGKRLTVFQALVDVL